MSLGAQGMIVSNRNNLKLRNTYRKPRILGAAQKVDTRYSNDIIPKAELSSARMIKVQRIRQNRTIAYLGFIGLSIIIVYLIISALLF